MNKVNNGNDFNDHFSDHGIRLINENNENNENNGHFFTNLINKLSSQKVDDTNTDCIAYSQYGTYPIDDSNLSDKNSCWKSLKYKFTKLHGDK